MNLEAKVLNKMYQEINFNNTLKDSYINHDHLAPCTLHIQINQCDLPH